MSSGTGGASRGGGVLVAALAIDSLGQGLFLPLSLVYFTELTPVPLALLGVLLSVANLITLPIPVWAGAMADRFGALPVVVAAQVMQAVGFFAYAWVSGPVGIFLAASLVALGVRFFWSAIFTAVADYADNSTSQRGTDTWYAISNGARTAGLAAGGLLTGVVVADGREAAYRAVAYGAAVCFALAAVLIAAFVRTGQPRRRPSTAPGPGYAALVRDRPFLGLVALNTVYALSSLMLGLALPTVVLSGIEGPSWLTASILAGNAILIAVLSAPVARRLAGRRRTRSLVGAAVLWSGWCALMATLVPGQLGWVIPVLLLATLLFTAAELTHAPVSNGLAASMAPVQARGRYLAVFQYSFTIASIASIAAPAFFGALFEVDHAAPWLALGLANAVTIAGLLLLEGRLPTHVLRDSAEQRTG
ncbi:MFS transporter [Nocardiopsis gilva]|uniref:MFS transporter n=1 Tax=Nocardiopsis gilva TaxID=280236 RepID=UPI000349690C|nr:MFS transporter [Nocardiopsis gilva]